MNAALRKLIVLAAMVFGLPLLGITVAGKPVSMYLEFPPTTRYVEHAPFSLLHFLLGLFLAVAPIAPFVRRAALYRTSEKDSRPDAFRLPRWGWAGIAVGVASWILAWTRIPWFAPLQAHTFTPLWLSFVVVMNALTLRRTGRCLMTDRPRFFLLLFPASAAFWWSFEYLNRFVQNWYYIDPGAYGPWEYFWLATLPFSTVLPAVLSAREWLRSFPRLDRPFRGFLPLPVPGGRQVSFALLAVAGAGLAGIGVRPDLFYPLLWVSPLLILVALDGIAGRPHLLSGIAEGDWRDVVGFSLGALVCGFFWEMWNVHSLAKWEYSIPYVHRFLLFEMPALGYSGYLPFGLVCAAVAALLDEARGETPRPVAVRRPPVCLQYPPAAHRRGLPRHLSGIDSSPASCGFLGSPRGSGSSKETGLDWFGSLVEQYGGAAMFLASFLENVGLPFPAFPLFILAGALLAAGHGSLPVLLTGAVLGAIAADGIWYDLGRRRGKKVLHLLCRISLNPDVCVESAVDQFHRRKAATIVLAKFLPGVNTVMPPLAGMAAVPLSLFLVADSLGSLLWAGSGIWLGTVFGPEIAAFARTIQGGMAWVLGAGLIVSILWAVGYRVYLVKRYAAPRIEPEELYEWMRGDNPPVVLDLRRDEYYDRDGRMIAGSYRLRPATFHRFAHHLPRDRDLVFYCT